MNNHSNPTVKRYTLKWLIITITCIVMFQIVGFLLGDSYSIFNLFSLPSHGVTISEPVFSIVVVAVGSCLGLYDYKNAITKYRSMPLSVEEIYAIFEDLACDYENSFLEKFGKKRLGLNDDTLLNAQGSQQLRLIIKAHNAAQAGQGDMPSCHPMFIAKLQDIVNTRSWIDKLVFGTQIQTYLKQAVFNVEYYYGVPLNEFNSQYTHSVKERFLKARKTHHPIKE